MKSLDNNPKEPSSLKPLALAILLALGVNSAWASNLKVNDLSNIAVPGDGKCTLREAINNANTNSDSSGFDCLPGSGADNISFSISGSILLDSTLNISDAAGLTLDGISQNVTLSGNYKVRVILVNPGASLTLKNLTVANGSADPQGGGIYNQNGNLTVANSTFLGNHATRTGGGIANYGNPGGILTITNSTFSANNSSIGGAIRNLGGVASIVNSTIVGNSVNLPFCNPGFICAMEDSGGGIENSGTLNLDNSIVAGNTAAVGADDIGGSVDTANYNLIGDSLVYYRWNGLGLPLPLNGNNGNIAGVDANTILETTLANNGGPTQTLALLTGSEAIDAGNNTICANARVNNVDQRGVTRPQGAKCDIGAFEMAVAASTDLTVSQTSTPNIAMVRDYLTWTITVTNSGTLDATGVKLSDTLPASGLKSISVSTSQGSCNAAVNSLITCNLGGLASGGSANIKVKGIPANTGPLTNRASVVSDQPDAQPLNNSTSQTTTVQPLLCNGLKPTIIGTTGNDVISGTKGRDIIHGLSGNDNINGGNDNDIICGGEGQDALSGSSGNDGLNGGAGTDSCDGGAGTDTTAECEVKTNIP